MIPFKRIRDLANKIFRLKRWIYCGREIFHTFNRIFVRLNLRGEKEDINLRNVTTKIASWWNLLQVSYFLKSPETHQQQGWIKDKIFLQGVSGSDFYINYLLVNQKLILIKHLRWIFFGQHWTLLNRVIIFWGSWESVKNGLEPEIKLVQISDCRRTLFDMKIDIVNTMKKHDVSNWLFHILGLFIWH